ncbi:PIR protein [Plasmodium malariae]|uniref:PIR protein n=1 Tax=Plasmodium malariae TaxID=5858 RepID=A0A1D3JH79_PLAMA|nr:PIR protein [Plasmodium malariae]SBT85653.1 PIR protein [Plasmodium malariae]
MASGAPGENETSVTLFLKYKKEFETVIQDILNKRGGENPGRKCALIEQDKPNFTTPCQEVGRYLIEIKELHKSDNLGRCNYLNYRINSDVNYSKDPGWFAKYNIFSSQLDNICENYIKKIEPDILDKLKGLYRYYEYFNKYEGQESDSGGSICNNIKRLYSFYNDNYKECQKKTNDPFCDELINFKNAYDDKMNKFTPCEGLPQTLPPKEEVDYLFFPILTTAIVLLMSFTIFFLYKFTPLKSWTYNRLRKKKIIELNKFQEESRESLQNLHEEVNRNYEGSSHNISYQPQGDT